jgi:IS5 family transposase
VADTSVFAELLEAQEVAVLADKGYDSAANRAALAARGARDGIMRRLFIDPDSLMGRIEVERNQKLARLRAPSEGVFASLKRWRRLACAIYTGIERVTQQVQLAVTVHNALKLMSLRQKGA